MQASAGGGGRRFDQDDEAKEHKLLNAAGTPSSSESDSEGSSIPEPSSGSSEEEDDNDDDEEDEEEDDDDEDEEEEEEEEEEGKKKARECKGKCKHKGNGKKGMLGEAGAYDSDLKGMEEVRAQQKKRRAVNLDIMVGTNIKEGLAHKTGQAGPAGVLQDLCDYTPTVA